VVAVDARGAINAGEVWTFSTEDLPYPPPVGEMISIPAGEFQMGCDQANLSQFCRFDEFPLHVVYLDSYAIDKYEVTNKQYRECVDKGACNLPRRFDSYHRDSYFYDPEYDYYPVLFVSWWDARDYCTWTGKRLPTEAEFEKAARGVIDTRAWPWGNEFPDCSRLNFTDSSIEPRHICMGDTTAVGSYPTGASPYGVMDVAGNVFEWVSDIYSANYYAVSPYKNPPGPTEPADELYFVIRGGTHRSQWFYPQVSHRHTGHHGDHPFEDAPYYRNNQVGIRCAKSID
jgi:serine/threonine-protein kinase